MEFDYDEAFSRNLGWVTREEQLSLRGRHVAIAGMGGVGGIHLLTLARLGIGGFSIADFDRFDIANFNRQVGAMMSTIGEPKIDVLARMARDINPELRLRCFPQGVQLEEIDKFLSNADLFVDGFDFFAIEIRRRVFKRCAELGIPAITAAPIGMGTAWLTFVPGGMSFEEYFRLADQSENEQFLRFFVGLTPQHLQSSYLVDPTRLDLPARRGPSTTAGCTLAAGVVAVAAVKILLQRGDVKPAPHHHHFDPFVGHHVTTYLPQGNAGAKQRRQLDLIRRALAGRGDARPVVPQPQPTDIVGRILDLARWTPSGDNRQPWEFERTGELSVAVNVAATDPDNVYEYRGGEPLLLAAGMLLASMEIAASSTAHAMHWEHTLSQDGHRLAITFVPDGAVAYSPLCSVLVLRSVDRAAYRNQKLSNFEKVTLAESLEGVLEIDWFESLRQRLQIGSLGRLATDIRLRAREAFETHRSVIDLKSRQSPHGLPIAALGLPTFMQRALRWQLKTWARTNLVNRAIGTAGTAVQLDLLPAAFSAAFFLLRTPPGTLGSADETLRAGAAIQRFWLTATRLGLVMQPALATLIFADHGARETQFSSDAKLRSRARQLAARFSSIFRIEPKAGVFLGRIGTPSSRSPKARSVRKAISDLSAADIAGS